MNAHSISVCHCMTLALSSDVYSVPSMYEPVQALNIVSSWAFCTTLPACTTMPAASFWIPARLLKPHGGLLFTLQHSSQCLSGTCQPYLTSPYRNALSLYTILATAVFATCGNKWGQKISSLLSKVVSAVPKLR